MISCDQDKRQDKPDVNNLFNKPKEQFIGKPIKHLLLESKQKLKYYSFDVDEWVFLQGIKFGFENGTQIIVKIKDFHFLEKKGDHLWDINRCILENVASIEEIIDEPSGSTPHREYVLSIFYRIAPS